MNDSRAQGPNDELERPLKVLLVATSFPRSDSDWVGLFMYKLVEALAARPDIELLLWAPPGPRPPGVRDVFLADDAQWLGQLLDAGGIAHLLRQHPLRALRFGLSLLLRLLRLYRRGPVVDLTHVNWLQNALPLMPLRRRSLLISVLGTDFAMLDSGPWSTLLRRLFRRHPTLMAPNAPWMLGRLEQLTGGGARGIRCVPFGVDQAWFDLRRKPAPGSGRCWLVVLRVTEAKIGPLFDWGREIAAAGDELHLFGPLQDDMPIPEWVHYHGAVTAAELQAEWFPRASALISLSRHYEGRPQVILEAMAGALPIVASPLSAHRELVRDGETGYLVDNRKEFIHALDRLRDETHNRRIGEAGRAWVRVEIGNWSDCAARYVACYQQLLHGS